MVGRVKVARTGAVKRGIAIARAARGDLSFVLALLERCGLPGAGVRDHFDRFLVARLGGKRVGCVGMEVYGADILLRSLAVDRAARDRGIGAALLTRILAEARAAGGARAWGLTTTGEKPLFRRFGFEVVPRPTAPPALHGSLQFQDVCPVSAALIVRSLPER